MENELALLEYLGTEAYVATQYYLAGEERPANVRPWTFREFRDMV